MRYRELPQRHTACFKDYHFRVQGWDVVPLEETRSEQPIDAYIERYFAVRPKAADTVEGIAAWWLPREIQHPTVAELTDALERLVAVGRLQRHVMFDERVVYSKTQQQSGDRG